VSELSCEEVIEATPGYALDLLDPRERRSVQGHARRCRSCRDHLAQAAESAAVLLSPGAGWMGASCAGPPLPPAEPRPADPAAGSSPPGTAAADPGGAAADPGAAWAWDDAVWDEPLPTRTPRRRLRVAAAMAAVVILVAGSALGPEVEQSGGDPPLSEAVLVAGGSPVGSVRVFAGRPRLVDIRVDGLVAPGSAAGGSGAGLENGPVRAEAADAAGRVVPVGTFQVRRGRATWVGAEPAGLAGLAGVLLVGPAGSVLASATFSDSAVTAA
jgi:hypothetical protein